MRWTRPFALLLILALLILPATALSQQRPVDESAEGRWVVQVMNGEEPLDMGEGEYLHDASVGPGNFQPGPATGDWAVYRTVNVAPGLNPTCHPTNPDLFEVPNLLGVNPVFMGDKGYCYAMHLASNPAFIGIPAGFGGRPKLTSNHYIVIQYPNPDYGKPNCKFCGTHLNWEYSGQLIQVAFSMAQHTEVWYFKDFHGQMLLGGNHKIFLQRDNQGHSVNVNGNIKITTNISYGAGQTARRPGDEGLPNVSFSVPVSGGVMGVVRFNPLIFPDIPRDTTGHTYELLTRDWLKCALPDDYDARFFPVIANMPPACSYTGFEFAATPIPVPTDTGGPLIDPTEVPVATIIPAPIATAIVALTATTVALTSTPDDAVATAIIPPATATLIPPFVASPVPTP